MAARKDVENARLNDANLQAVKMNLNPADGSKPWTKKACCEFLGITYNTTRLDALLNAYSERIEYDTQQRAAKRGTPISKEEAKFIIEAYLEGDSYETISKSIYRGTTAVKSVLNENNVPIRPTAYNYFKPELIPYDAMRERFEVGEIVYSAKYNVNAKIRAEKFEPQNGYVYLIWLLGDWQQFAYSSVSELASYEHLREIGISV